MKYPYIHYIWSKYYSQQKNLEHTIKFLMYIKQAPLHPFGNN